MGEVEISPRAYVKMCLHAARYPHVAVNGLLLAQKRQLTAGPPKCLYITDCVPLFHSNLSLTMMLEVALNQVDSWSSESDLLLAGYYQANSGMDDKSPNTLAQKTAGRIAELYDDAVLIMLDNRKFGISPRLPPLTILEQRDHQWVPKDKNLGLQELLLWPVKAFLEASAVDNSRSIQSFVISYRGLQESLASLTDCRRNGPTRQLQGARYLATTFQRVMWTDWESSRHICQSLLEAKEYSRLVDFDSHLDDIRQDWTNQQLNTEIAQLVSVANGSV